MSRVQSMNLSFGGEAVSRSCPSRKIWDFRSSKINFDAIREVKSHLELYVLQIFQVVFTYLGGSWSVWRGSSPLPPNPSRFTHTISPNPASQYKFFPSADNVSCLPLVIQEIVGISCSWCGDSYHVGCYSDQFKREPCHLGPLRNSIIPPTWIVKVPPMERVSQR